jgi:hypothetical protein
MRSVGTLLPQYFVRRHETALESHPIGVLRQDVALEVVRRPPQRSRVAPRERGRERGALPEIVMIGLGDRGAEAPLKLSLEREQLLPLVLQRMPLGEVKVDRDEDDVGDYSPRVRSTWAFSYTSITSPSFTSMKFSSVMPHSKPPCTSRTSSLKRRSVAIRPS